MSDREWHLKDEDDGHAPVQVFSVKDLATRELAEKLAAARLARFEEQIQRATEEQRLGGPSEVRVTDPVTGGQKGSKPSQLGALCPRALMELGRVAGFGAKKYERFNYLKGYAWSLSADALLRHLLAFLGGENRDPESGCLHMAHVAWHGLALAAFQLRNVGTDDRAPAAGDRE